MAEFKVGGTGTDIFAALPALLSFAQGAGAQTTQAFESLSRTILASREQAMQKQARDAASALDLARFDWQKKNDAQGQLIDLRRLDFEKTRVGLAVSGLEMDRQREARQQQELELQISKEANAQMLERNKNTFTAQALQVVASKAQTERRRPIYESKYASAVNSPDSFDENGNATPAARQRLKTLMLSGGFPNDDALDMRVTSALEQIEYETIDTQTWDSVVQLAAGLGISPTDAADIFDSARPGIYQSGPGVKKASLEYAKQIFGPDRPPTIDEVGAASLSQFNSQRELDRATATAAAQANQALAPININTETLVATGIQPGAIPADIREAWSAANMPVSIDSIFKPESIFFQVFGKARTLQWDPNTGELTAPNDLTPSIKALFDRAKPVLERLMSIPEVRERTISTFSRAPIKVSPEAADRSSSIRPNPAGTPLEQAAALKKSETGSAMTEDDVLNMLGVPRQWLDSVRNSLGLPPDYQPGVK